MSKLEELIEELCPNGVELKKIDDCADYIQPSKYIVSDTNYVEEGTPVLTPGQSFILGYTTEEDGIYEASKENPIILFDDFTGSLQWVDFPFKVKSSACKIIKAKNTVGIRYLYHLMANLNFRSDEHKRLWISIYSQFEVPVPPLEVQREIVRILDKFTDLTSELQTELQAELQARAKQYEYYRENLILNSYGETVKLEDIVDIKLGLTATPTYTDSGVIFISAQNTSSDYLDLTNVKYISEDDYEKASSNAKPKKGDILFTRVGSNLGHPVIVETDIDLCMFVSLGYLRVKDFSRTSNIYIKHWMNTELFWEQVRKNVHGAAKVNLNTGWLKDFEVILPSLEKQNEIVGILNNLDILCKDISVDLPAEIEARQKQYEYYRNKLLTFKELQA